MARTIAQRNSREFLAEAGRDIHWAAGLTITRDDLFEIKKWKGQNWLGKLLSTVCRDLKNL